MKTLDIQFADVVGYRLTVTPTRITMKFPKDVEGYESVRVKKFFTHIAEDLKDTDQSYRGRIPVGQAEPYSMMMVTNRKTLKKLYNESNYTNA